MSGDAPLSSSSLTIGTWPCCAAQWSDVKPCFFRKKERKKKLIDIFFFVFLELVQVVSAKNENRINKTLDENLKNKLQTMQEKKIMSIKSQQNKKKEPHQ
jgi:hypothetical protein